MKKEYKMSAARQQELQDELTYLKTVREKEVAELIKEARGFGDLSENSEYDEAKNEQGKLYSRIAELEAEKAAKVEPAAEEETVSVKVCPVCGAASEDKFCPHCGAPMGE